MVLAKVHPHFGRHIPPRTRYGIGHRRVRAQACAVGQYMVSTDLDAIVIIVEKCAVVVNRRPEFRGVVIALDIRSEEHTSELQSLMRISYAVFCLKKKNIPNTSEINCSQIKLVTLIALTNS